MEEATIADSRRQRRTLARQAQILEAATAVFSQKGYERATTREIAAAADLSEGTLYNYFQNKRDLLIGVAKAFADEVTHEIEDLQSQTIETMMSQLLTNRFRRSQDRRLFILFTSEARHNPEVRQYYVQEALYRIVSETEALLTKLINNGTLRAVNPAVAARTLSATIMGFGVLFEMDRHLWESGPTLKPEELGVQVTDIFLNGLSPYPTSEEV